MRKELLINLLLQYNRDTAFRLIPKNPRIVLLNEFLKSPQIAELPASAEITFEQFEAYLKEQNQDPASLFSLAYFRSGIRSVNVFIKFKYGIMDADLKVAIRNIPIPKVERHEASGPFFSVPTEIRQAIYNGYLTDQDMGRLARVSSFFKTDTQANDIWIARLIKLGCNRDLLLQLKEADIISNYKMLYKNIKSFYGEDLNHIKFRWQLLCFSGELKAIHFGLESGEINEETAYGVHSVAPIHYLAFAGQVADLQLLKERLAVRMDAVTGKSANILHFAAMGNSPAAMQYALDQKISKDSLDSAGCNALHWACAHGAEASLKFALDVLKLDGSQRTHAGCNALHLAVIKKNKKGILLALNLLKISPNSKVRPQNAITCNALHVAAGYSSIDILKFIHNELKISYRSRDSNSNSILHYAVENNTPEMMCFIVRELGIKADVGGGYDETPLHRAAVIENVSGIKYGVLELNMNLYSESSFGNTPMRNAIACKKKLAVIALREVGYDPNHRDNNNHTAFDYLQDSSYFHDFSPVEQAELQEALTCEVHAEGKRPSI